ncbi:DUF2312 domain-containing protein [Dyadobacter sp. CY327]|uniref:DUF2312 domain-containing protein n=1 Tax=Dyadobacter sp. CY327 TaxID=2907301 RepID=UPI001F1E582E|nr:DUF2312 domain-containing protein [Dyadobacter sp. CY327]MCE7073677.1 DUF2312 domain-containing protein [Dyadobacter sp. CY327]
MSEADSRLGMYITRIENLDDTRKGLSADIRDVYQEAKSAGYSVKALREVIRFRKMKPEDRNELEIADVYLVSLGDA